MSALFDRATLLTIFSALIVVCLCLWPGIREIFPIWLIAKGAFVGDALFHELGHTIFYWLFGQPAIPMIFTLFGSDQAGGMAMAWDRSWFVQGAAFAFLAYACYWLRENIPGLFISMLIFSIIIVTLAFTRYTETVISFMGHGTSILMGGFFLFRAWIYLDARNAIERWLNAFFGFYLTLSNFMLGYNILYDPATRERYTGHQMFGAMHNDLVNVAMDVGSWSVLGVAWFMMVFSVFTIVSAFIMAVLLRDNFADNPY